MASQSLDEPDLMEEETQDAPNDANGKRQAKEMPERLPGKSAFPVSRVRKILKADKELPMVTKEAIFLVSMATEMLISRLSYAAQKQAAREKRATVQKRDIDTIVRRGEEYYFLEEIMEATAPTTTASKEKNPTKRTTKKTQKDEGDDEPRPATTLFDAFARAKLKAPAQTADVESLAASEGVSVPPESSRASTSSARSPSVVAQSDIEDEMDES